MKKPLFALCILLLISPFSQAQNTVYADLPGWVVPVADIPALAPDSHYYDQQFLLVDRQLNLVSPTPVEYKRYASKVVSIAGVESASQISIDYDPAYQSVAIHRLQVVRDGKIMDKKASAQIDTFKREVSLDSLLYNGDETLHIVLDNVNVGDVIDLGYTITGYNPVFGQHREWYIKTGWASSVALVNARILAPTNSTISVINLDGKGQGDFRQTQENGVTTFTYQERNGLYDFDEPEQPIWFNPYPYLHVSSFRNWEDVVAWALPLYEITPQDEEVQALAADIRQTYSDDIPKQIVAAIHYVQNHIRYLGIENGIGSHKPRPAAQIVAQGYGDCKDKALLLSSLLGALGIKAHPALVDTTWREHLPFQPTAPFSFNHVIVAMDYDNRRWWIDATRTHQGNRLETLAQANLGYALVIEPESAGLSPMTPAQIPITQDIEQRYVVNHANAQSYLTVKTVYRGLEAERWRRYLESKPLKELGEEYANYYAGFFGGLDFLRPLSVEDDLDANEVTLNEAYVIEELWSKINDTYSFVISGDIVDDFLVKPDLIRRKTPFRLGREGAVRQRIMLSLPQNWDVEQTDSAVSSPFFDFSSSLKAVKGPGLSA